MVFFASFSAQNGVIMSRKHAQNEPKNMREERRIIEVLQNVESLGRAEPAAAIDFMNRENNSETRIEARQDGFEARGHATL